MSQQRYQIQRNSLEEVLLRWFPRVPEARLWISESTLEDISDLLHGEYPLNGLHISKDLKKIIYDPYIRDKIIELTAPKQFLNLSRNPYLLIFELDTVDTVKRLMKDQWINCKFYSYELGLSEDDLFNDDALDQTDWAFDSIFGAKFDISWNIQKYAENISVAGWFLDWFISMKLSNSWTWYYVNIGMKQYLVELSKSDNIMKQVLLLDTYDNEITLSEISAIITALDEADIFTEAIPPQIFD